MIKKVIMSLLIIVAIAAFIMLVIDMSRQAPEQPPVPESITKKQPPVTEEITPVPPPAEVVPPPVSKEMIKKKAPVPGEVIKEPEPVVEEVKKEPEPVEVKKEKAPVVLKSAEEISDLQEQCQKMSKKIFRKEYKDGVIENTKGMFLYKYKHHYNKKLDKCFMLITEDGMSERYKKLLDVDENNSYGSVRINNNRENMGCYLLNKKCSSEEGWDSIVKPYMEE